MNKELCHVLKNKLLDLPFVDLLAGMAQTLVENDPIQDSTNTIRKRMPYSTDVVAPGCQGKNVLLVPDSSRKSIIYFEDYGTYIGPAVHGLQGYQSNIRVICWMNREKLLGDPGNIVAASAMNQIIFRLTGKGYVNAGIFTRLLVRVKSIPPQDPALFGKYSYDETVRQYLMPPFEFFGIDLSCSYHVAKKCLPYVDWQQSSCG